MRPSGGSTLGSCRVFVLLGLPILAGLAAGQTSPFGYELVPVAGPGESSAKGSAAEALLRRPNSLAQDAQGNLYFADERDHRIRKISTDGTISCTYSASPASLDKVPAKGQNGTLTITASSGCAWAAVSDKIWITLLPPATGSGSGSVEYRISENTDTLTRSGKITLRDVTVTVTQQEAGAVPPSSGAPQILSCGVANAASYQSPITPFSYVSIYARNVAPGIDAVTWDSVLSNGTTTLPQVLAGVTVRIGGKPGTYTP